MVTRARAVRVAAAVVTLAVPGPGPAAFADQADTTINPILGLRSCL